jgi:bifunctional non-homologous end joining protein LigD
MIVLTTRELTTPRVDLKQLPLSQRRAVLATAIEPSDHVGLSYVSDETAAQMINFVRSHGLRG